MEKSQILKSVKNKISKEAFLNLKKWLTEREYKEFWPEILKIAQKKDLRELEDSFYTTIIFGTGGRRGKMGIGPNRINFRTIGESAQGLANYLLRFSRKTRKKGIVIAYDSRHFSREFAKHSAKVFCGNGFKTYFFSDLRSTPELSFAIRHLSAAAGVVISASHNPPSDNGFKVYWRHGGQIVPPQDLGIIAEVNKVKKIKTLDLKKASEKGLYREIGREIDKAYIHASSSVSLDDFRQTKIVFSPLHGTGFTSVLPLLKRLGFEVLPLDSQMKPDGDFPNVYHRVPNPEFSKTQDEAIEYAAKIKADLVITSDPDADRIGIAYPDKNGRWHCLSGNQISVLLLNFLLEQRSRQRKLHRQNLVVKTFVTTDLVSQIAKSYRLRLVEDLLVGFKYVADVIEREPIKENFIFGGEESHGFLFSHLTRDKDAAQAALIFAELVSYLKERGKTVDEYLFSIYQKFGYFKENLYNMMKAGKKGQEKIAYIMKKLRKEPPKEIANRPVLKIVDRLTNEIFDGKTGKVIGRVRGFKGEMITFVLSDDGFWKVTARPSGTEPKAKFYISGKGNFSDRFKVDKGVEEITMEIIRWTKSNSRLRKEVKK